MNIADTGDMFVIKFVLLTYRLLGMAPVTISKTQSSKLKFSQSWTGAVYNLSLITVVLTECYRQIPTMLGESSNDETSFSQMYRNVLIVSGNTFLVILLLRFCLCQRKLTEIGNELVEMDRYLDQLPGIYHLRAGRTYVFFVLTLHLTIIITYCALYLAVHPIKPAFFTMIVFPCTVMSFYTLQYSLVVFVIERRFTSLNEALASVETKTVGVNDRSVVSIFVIKRAYARLYRICSEISNFYAPLTVLIVVNLSTSLLYELYKIFFGLTRRSSVPPSPTIKFILGFLWISVRKLPIVLLTSTVRKCHMQMQMTSDVVHKLQDKLGACRDVKSELKNFITDLMHRSFQFTAYGMFRIDCSLLKSIVSTMTTYFVLFIQFQLASDKEASE